jgi:hypothetical protein
MRRSEQGEEGVAALFIRWALLERAHKRLHGHTWSRRHVFGVGRAHEVGQSGDA